MYLLWLPSPSLDPVKIHANQYSIESTQRFENLQFCERAGY